jgi:hypothetical protein
MTVQKPKPDAWEKQEKTIAVCNICAVVSGPYYNLNIRHDSVLDELNKIQIIDVIMAVTRKSTYYRLQCDAV